MTDWLPILLTFFSGVLVEMTAVYWTHYSQRGQAPAAALCSMIQGTAYVVGIGESVHDWHLGPAFVLGYGLGTFAAVGFLGHVNSKRRKESTP